MKHLKFKKTIAILLCCLSCIMSVLCLTACRSDKEGGKGNDEADVHVFYYTYSDTYISGVRSALDKALKDRGISFQDYDGNGNQTTQTEQVQTAITKGAKVIVVNIVNTGSDDAAANIIGMASAQGVPVIFFNREVSDDAVRSYDKCVFVGTDAAEAGKMQGELIGEYLVSNYETCDLNKDGEISYIMFKGEEGNNEAIFRTRYGVEEADRVLEENSRPPLKFYDPSNTNKYLVDKNGQWSAAAANEYMTTALTSFNDESGNMIELVICNNDGMAEGAITALNTIGYNTGSGKSIPVFGVDATDAAQSLIKAGKMAGTIKQDAQGMADAIADIAQNATESGDVLKGTENYNMDENVNKIRIPYSKYTGQ